MPSLSSHHREVSRNALPAIFEDDEDSAPVLSRQLPFRAGAGPKRFSPSMAEPGQASAFSDTSSTLNGGEKVLGLRNNKRIAKRGGWKRLGVIALVILVCPVALIVGLAVGLRNSRSHNSEDSSVWTSNGASHLNSTFPAGNYTILTYLSSTSQNCTSNSATWRCYPYTTYASSPSDSYTSMDWMIYAFTSTGSQDSNPVYTVSTTNNPFSINFSNATMVLLDSGLASERYSFNTTAVKPVIPTVPLDDSNLSATCYFNTTIFEASLYTRLNSTYPSANAPTAFPTWPYAATFRQVAQSGSSTPYCIAVGGDAAGNFTVQASGQQCTCDYVS